MGPCVKIHKQMLQKVYQLAAIKTGFKTTRTMGTAVIVNRFKSIACMLAKGELSHFWVFL